MTVREIANVLEMVLQVVESIMEVWGDDVEITPEQIALLRVDPDRLKNMLDENELRE